MNWPQHSVLRDITCGLVERGRVSFVCTNHNLYDNYIRENARVFISSEVCARENYRRYCDRQTPRG